MRAKDRGNHPPHKPGVSNGRAKITEAQVRAIRADGRKHAVIAAEYGLGRTTVGMIIRREAWSHVAEES